MAECAELTETPNSTLEPTGMNISAVRDLLRWQLSVSVRRGRLVTLSDYPARTVAVVRMV